MRFIYENTCALLQCFFTATNARDLDRSEVATVSTVNSSSQLSEDQDDDIHEDSVTHQPQQAVLSASKVP